MAYELKYVLAADDNMTPAFNSAGASGAKAAENIDKTSDSADRAKESMASFSYESVKALQDINLAAETVKFENVSRKMTAALAPDFVQAEQQFKSYFEKTEDFVKSKVTLLAIALVTGISAAVIGGLYALYKSLDFIAGLFTGSSYKSESIDALVATTKEVTALQEQLQLTTVDANALTDALRRLGVDKTDYATVFLGVETAIRSNQEELDRLGVKYTDINGKMLGTYEVVKNAKGVLDQYSAGWDRNQAAAALGLGTYEQINKYLKVNQDEFRKSKDRLDDYNLGLGPETQAAVSRYQTAMLDFNNELELTSQGFKRVWADVTMPILTNFAEYLKDGWPFAVNVFRYTSAQIASLLIGLDEAVYVSVTSIIAGLTSIVDVGEGVGNALIKILQGDLSGAGDELSKGWRNAEKTISDAGDRIVTHSQKNASALKLAWAFDDRSIGAGGVPQRAGKKWSPAPDEEDEQQLEDFSRALKAVTGEIDKYIQSLKNVGREELSLGRDALTEALADQKTLLQENGRLWGDMVGPLKAYELVIDGVSATQKKMIADTRSMLQGLMSGEAGKLGTGGKEGQTTFAGDLKKELEKLKLAELEIEKNGLTLKYKAWEDYYKQLKSLVVEKDKEINKAHQELMEDRLEMDKAFTDLNVRPSSGSSDPYAQYFDMLDNWKTRIGAALSSGDVEQGRKNLKAVKDEILAWQKSHPEGVFTDLTKEVRSFGETMGAGITTKLETFKINVVSGQQSLSDMNDVMGQVANGLEDLGQKKIKTLNDEMFDMQVGLADAKIRMDDLREALKLLDDKIAEQVRTVTLNVEDFVSPALKSIKTALDALVSKKYTIKIAADNYAGAPVTNGLVSAPGSGYTWDGATRTLTNETGGGSAVDNYEQQVMEIPGAATGARIVRGGLVRVHDEEVIKPAQLDRNAPAVRDSGGVTITGDFKPTIVVPEGTPKQQAMKIIDEVEILLRTRYKKAG
jgi:hypothetical protein